VERLQGLKPPGLIPVTKPDTMKAMQISRDRCGCAGLILGHFGDWNGHVGLETDRDLLTEIEKHATRAPKPPGKLAREALGAMISIFVLQA